MKPLRNMTMSVTRNWRYNDTRALFVCNACNYYPCSMQLLYRLSVGFNYLFSTTIDVCKSTDQYESSNNLCNHFSSFERAGACSVRPSICVSVRRSINISPMEIYNLDMDLYEINVYVTGYNSYSNTLYHSTWLNINIRSYTFSVDR